MDELITIPDCISAVLKEILLTLKKDTLLELLQDNGILIVEKWENGILRSEIFELVNKFQERSSKCALSLLLASSSVLTAFSAMEFRDWVQFGSKLLDGFPENEEVCDAYIKSSPLFLSKDTISILGSWVNQGHKIADKSIAAGTEFFLSIPKFLAHGRQFHVRDWSEKIKQLLLLDRSAEQAALYFIAASTDLIQIMSFRELQSWSSAGVRIMRDSPPAGLKYFSQIPERLESLYRIEMRKVFEMTASIARVYPGKAIDFYRKAPGELLGLNPNIRESVLNKVKKNTEKNPENACDLFDEIVTATFSLPYPLQETVMKMETGIAELSEDASRAYFRSVNGLMKEVHESFLPIWVENGCLLLEEDEKAGIEHFSLTTSESKEAFSKWKEAVFFDDQKNTLGVFVRALCGREAQLQNTEMLEANEIKSIKRHQADGGHVIFLPPFVAEEKSRRNNFSQYKIAAAHQAGYIEFDTFGSKFTTIRTVLGSFPLKELALDIFFILEDGRVDYNLKKEYAGLRKDIDRILKNSIEKRSYPIDNPFSEALEILLRLSVDLLDENEVSPLLSDYLMFLKNTMKGFFETAESVWDCFTKTLEVYNLISRFKEDTLYEAIVPLSYRELPDIELVSGGGATDEVPDEVMAGDHESDGEGSEFSEEELQRMIDLMKETELVEPLKKGTGGQGLFITNLDKLISQDEDDVDLETSSVVTEKSSRLPATTHAEHKRGPYYYDEWDYIQKAYRRKWCCLRELNVPSPGVELYDIIHKSYGRLIQQVKAQFQRIRPEVLNTIKRVEWGSEIDFNAMLESVVDRKIGNSPSDRIFMRREKKIRRISTLLLVDMSASTDRLASSVSNLTGLPENTGPGNQVGGELGSALEKKIIDIEIESLVIMTEALEALDDDYAIYGFSGYGREEVNFYCVKEFDDRYGEELKSRICGIQPQKSTRMGPAIRHATAKLRTMDADHRLLIILSDGYPQDMNYGEDRTSQDYALHDTMMAMIEARRAEIKPFCITVDQCGDDYLRKMSDPKSYLVIQDIYALPQILPKVVESLIG